MFINFLKTKLIGWGILILIVWSKSFHESESAKTRIFRITFSFFCKKIMGINARTSQSFLRHG